MKLIILAHKNLGLLLTHRFNYRRRFLSGLGLWNEEISSEIKHKIERYWADKLYHSEQGSSKEKYYVLSMFPYPSGYLHMGHVRVYTISDTIARYQRLNKKNVIHPIGWDAFGLPAENAAIERQIAPEEWTLNNIAHMKKQLKQLGCSFDWEREIATCDPHYYCWTQDLFLKLYNAGLVYRREALVNWDPVDQTVLADEQVDENGCSWRSGAKVEKKLLKQWFVRTTRFAKDLYDGLDNSILHDWRDIIKLQKHWIGECDGVNFDFKLSNDTDSNFVTLWTSKPELIEHAQFVAVTQNHILARKERVTSSDGTVRLKSQLKNPLNGQVLPVFVTEEIKFLPESDSHIGFPTVSQDDLTFARAHDINFQASLINETADDHFQKRIEILERARHLKVGGYWSSAKLRDWLISRQRYWGTPIPIIYCQKCGTVPVPQRDLPVELPKLTQLSHKGRSPLEDVSHWVHTSCPTCDGPANRETDTMDTFVDSSWYFLRYLDPKNTQEMFDKAKVWKMAPVDLYVGGKEHAVLHLYYARFVSYFLHSLGLLPEKEPFKRLLVHGMVMGRSYRMKGSGQYVPESKVKNIDLKKNQAVTKETEKPVVISWEKMSKSKHNGVDPDNMFSEYGTDTTRLLILADVSPTSHRNWNSNTFPGILNWQRRLWLTIRDFLKHRKDVPPMIPQDKFTAQEDYLWDSRNFYVKGTTFNYLISQQLSVALSKQQGLTNSIRRAPPAVFSYGFQFERALAVQLILLAPMAPHFASELWAGFVSAPNRLNSSGEIRWSKSVFEQDWPETDMDYKLELVCQVNGHENCIVKFLRKDLEKLTKDEAVEVAMKQEAVKTVLSTRNIIDVNFTIHTGCEGVVNILTDHPVPKDKNQLFDEIV